MDIAIATLLFLAGFIMIIKGSDWFLDGTIWIARVFGIPDIIIGATLVSLCTTLPEAMVSVNSAIVGNTDMALGNALGSIACNTGLILGITIIFSTPLLNDRKNLQQKGLLLITLLFFLLGSALSFGSINKTSGIILLTILAVYIANNVIKSRRNSNIKSIKSDVNKNTKSVFKNIFLFVIGIVLTIWGSDLLVENGQVIARAIGVPDIIIGLTMTAFGTSLPELMTSIASIKKKAYNISLGNILGANILNIVLVIGLSSTIKDIGISKEVISFHFPFILLIVGSIVLFLLFNRKRLNRRNGVFLLSSYLIYVILMYIR